MFCPKDQMNVAGHYAICIDLHALLTAAVSQAFNHDPKVLIPYKNIYPINSRKTDKIKPFLIIKFVFPTHITKIA